MTVKELREALAKYADDERVFVLIPALEEDIGVDHVEEYFDGEEDLVYVVTQS